MIKKLGPTFERAAAIIIFVAIIAVVIGLMALAFSISLEGESHTFNVFDRAGNRLGTFRGEINFADDDGEILQFTYDGEDYLVYAYFIDSVEEAIR